MRRALSSFLLGAFVWSLFAPLAPVLTTSTPALCCRRDGKHHCMSAGSGPANDQQPALGTVPSCCPYRSQIASRTIVVGLDASRTSEHYSESQIFLVRSDSLLRDHGSHSRITQRGPPSRFLQI